MVPADDKISGEGASAASRLKVVELVTGMPVEWRGRYVPFKNIGEHLDVSGSAHETPSSS